jgi:hypothetical protein
VEQADASLFPLDPEADASVEAQVLLRHGCPVRGVLLPGGRCLGTLT